MDYRAPLTNPTLGSLRKWDWSGRSQGVERGQGGKAYHRWGGGAKPVFGEGSYVVLFPLLSLPPPFASFWLQESGFLRP